jgi:N-acetylneuraminic acid mutarotase
MFSLLAPGSEQVPTRRCGHSACVYDKHMYILGGQGNEVYAEFWKVSLDTYQWTKLDNSVGAKVDGHMVVIWHKKMYVCGGYDGKNDNPMTWIYDLERGKWEVADTTGSVHPRSYAMGGLYNDWMVFFGGENKLGYYGHMSILDLPTLEYKTLCKTPDLIRACGVGTIYKDSLIVYGGHTQKKQWSNGLYEFNFKTLEWSTIDIVTDQIPTIVPCGGGSSAVVGNKIYYFGGYNGKNEMNTTWEFDYGARTWFVVKGRGDTPQPRCDHTTVTYRDKIFLLGGSDTVFITKNCL